MTQAERAWLDAISRIGCIVCVLLGLGETPAEVHHPLRGGRRRGHLFSIPLCPPHHRGGLNNAQIVSRHPFRIEFERRYGTEDKLLEATKRRVAALLRREV